MDCPCNTFFVHCFFRSLGELGIVGSHIENEHIFNVVNVIANFQWSKLVIQNLDYLIITIKIGLTLFKLGVMELYMKLMTYEAIMIDKHYKLVEEICLFK